jgi:hypothetical protein
MKNGTISLTVMNFSKEELVVKVPDDLVGGVKDHDDFSKENLRCVLSNCGGEEESVKEEIVLKPYDARLYVSME